MTEAHPTIVISVPRLFERIYSLVHKSVKEGSAIQQKIFEWALREGEKYWKGARGLTSLNKMIADKLVFNKLKERTGRSEEHTSELQSRGHLVCRLLLEKKNQQ